VAYDRNTFDPEGRIQASTALARARRGGALVPIAFAIILVVAGAIGWLSFTGPKETGPIAYLDLAPPAAKPDVTPAPEVLTLGTSAGNETIAAKPGAHAEHQPVPSPEEPAKLEQGTAGVPAEPAAAASPPLTAAPTEAPAAPTSAAAPAAEPAAASPTPPAPPALALAPAPDPKLVQQAPEGLLPVVAANGRTAFQAYARPFDKAVNAPRVAVIVASLGLRQSFTRNAIRNLPAEVTLAFTPYAKGLDDWVVEARENGHEILLQVPMEPIDYPSNDPGPQTLLTSLTPADNQKRMDWILGRTTGYVGLLTLMGSRFTTDANALQPVIDTLKKRGLMFVDSRAATRTLGPRMAAASGVPTASVSVVLDQRPTRTAIDQRLAELERAAQANGAAIGIAAEGAPVVLEAISAWAAGLPARGVVLAPVTALANRQAAE
jgi:polysaccharide deacetylase 2 family uncharacterized protein YibQ